AGKAPGILMANEHWRNVIWNWGRYLSPSALTPRCWRAARRRWRRALAQKKSCPVRPASIKPGPVSAALPGNRSTLQKFPSEEKK
ncbi:hypothetical protein K732_10189, partial [Salmonella enterica subsp. enterica serovar Saintpaul str. S-70]